MKLSTSALGVALVLATEDGSRGEPGFVTAAVERARAGDSEPRPPTLLACGPEPMLVAVAQLARRLELARQYLRPEAENPREYDDSKPQTSSLFPPRNAREHPDAAEQ